jgi:AcrR family transcriptional regulator
MSIAYDRRDMSPAPARTSNEAIAVAARRILEADGLPAVTMRAVADAVGVKGPSLYKRIPDRAALLRIVAEGVTADLERTLSIAAVSGDPRRDIRAAVVAYRAFVRSNPNGYRLLFADLPADALPDPGRLAALGAPLVQATRRLAGEADALEAARTVVAFAHGFVTMELVGAFRLGGDLDAAYAFGIEAILAGVDRAQRPLTG